MNELMNVYWLRRNHEIVLVPQCHKYLSTIKRLLTLTNNYGRKCAFVMSFSSFSSFSRLFSSQISLIIYKQLSTYSRLKQPVDWKHLFR